MLKRFVTPRVRQAVAATSGAMLLCGMMITWGFPAAALPQLEQPDSPIHLTTQQSSWFATVPLLMCIPGSLLGGLLYEGGGPRRVMLILTPLLCVSTMAMTTASWKVVQEAGIAEALLLTCRIIQGSIVALLNPFIPVYIYELCDQRLRGTFISMIEIWASLGFVLNYISGCFLTWYTIAWLLPLIILIPTFVGIFISPESPLWMARKGKEEEARKTLTLMRCTLEEVQADLKTVYNNKSDNQTCMESIRVGTKKANLMAIIASSLPLILKELSGFAVISIYIVHILNEAGVGMDPRWSSVVVGAVRIICNIFATFMLHRLSRRLMLVIGNSLVGLACASLGVFFYLQDTGRDFSGLIWLPFTALVIHTIGYAGAVGATTWTLAVEVLPGPVRSMGFAITNTAFTTTSFLVTKVFVDLKLLIGVYGVFWFFTASAVVYILVVLLYIPETYGLSMLDIENYWNNFKKKKTAVIV